MGGKAIFIWERNTCTLLTTLFFRKCGLIFEKLLLIDFLSPGQKEKLMIVHVVVFYSSSATENANTECEGTQNGIYDLRQVYFPWALDQGVSKHQEVGSNPLTKVAIFYVVS